MNSKRKFRNTPPSKIVFYTYPPLIYTWPIIVAGFLFAPLAAMGVSLVLLGWVYIAINLLVLFTIGVDLDRTKSIIWILVLFILSLLVALASYQELPVATNITHALGLVSHEYNPNFGLAMSIFLSIGFAIMVIGTRINDKWIVTHNEFEHVSLGRVDDSLARGAKTVRTMYPDLLELLVCCSGSLLIYDSLGKRLLRKIDHVPFLPFLRKRMSRFLELTAVTQSTSMIEEEEFGQDEYDADDDEQDRV